MNTGHHSKICWRLGALCLACLVLSACSRTVWQKPGAMQGDFEQAKAACMLEGLHNVPQDNRVVLLSEGRRYTRDRCRHDHDCLAITQYTPPQYGVRDMNTELRDQVVRACLYRNGWTEVTLED